jgi:hypothetical protein
MRFQLSWLLVLCLTPAMTKSVSLPATQEQAALAEAVFRRPQQAVIQSLTELLQERKQLSEAAAFTLRTRSLALLTKGEAASITTASVPLTPDSLRAAIPENTRNLVTSAGGRYFLSISISPIDSVRTRVRVVPTIIAFIPGARSPMGGRPLRSSGALESDFLRALQVRLVGP